MSEMFAFLNSAIKFDEKRENINTVVSLLDFLAHLSRRLIGELIVYEGICRPSSVCQHFKTTSSLKP